MRTEIIIGLLLAVTVQGQTPMGNRRNFVACPMVRDTKTIPCWLAEYQGDTYFLGIQQDTGAQFFPPQLLHEVLVEGTVGNGPRVCGGIPLEALKVSVLPEVNRACNVMLPAEESIVAPPGHRGAGPSPPRAEGAPERREPPAAPTPPFQAKEFTINYEFDSDYVDIRMSRVFGEILRYAQAVHPSRVEVRGYRATTRLSNGKDFVENERIAERRAKQVGQSLRDLGIAAEVVDVQWQNTAQPGDGVDDPMNRRTTIMVRP